MTMTDEIKDMAPKILEAIKKSNKVLLHCHPYPDPDSIGSVLAMASVLKKMGKDVVAILGDSEYPNNLLGLPNQDWLTPKNYTEINPKEFDLFIILDSSSQTQISQLAEVNFPENMNTIVIDHHKTNLKYGKLNLVESTYSSTCQVLFDLFTLWKVEIDKDVALYLFMGIFADTGGFKYQNTNSDTLHIASELSKIYPDYHKFVFDLENNRKPIELEMIGLALSSIEKHFTNKVVFSSVPYEEIKKRNLSKSDAMEGLIGSMLRSVMGWDLVASLVEAEPEVLTVSLRTRDENKFDVSKIAKAVGKNGGGHKGAAGTTIYAPLKIAKKQLLESISKTFPEFKKSKISD